MANQRQLLQYGEFGYDFNTHLKLLDLKELAAQLSIHVSSYKGKKPGKPDLVWYIERHFAQKRVNGSTHSSDYLHPTFNIAQYNRAHTRQVLAIHGIRYLDDGRALSDPTVNRSDLQSIFSDKIHEMRAHIGNIPPIVPLVPSEDQIIHDLRNVSLGQNQDTLGQHQNSSNMPQQANDRHTLPLSFAQRVNDKHALSPHIPQEANNVSGLPRYFAQRKALPRHRPGLTPAAVVPTPVSMPMPSITSMSMPKPMPKPSPMLIPMSVPTSDIFVPIPDISSPSERAKRSSERQTQRLYKQVEETAETAMKLIHDSRIADALATILSLREVLEDEVTQHVLSDAPAKPQPDAKGRLRPGRIARLCEVVESASSAIAIGVLTRQLPDAIVQADKLYYRLLEEL